MKRVITSSAVAIAATSLMLAGAGAAEAKAKTFPNCTAMHKSYAHGVGKNGAHDRTSGTPVTNFKRSNELYQANRKSDRDGDGIACEQR